MQWRSSKAEHLPFKPAYIRAPLFRCLTAPLFHNNSSMSFGFSVGDFLTAAKLISEITTCLQSVGGAKSEYQELIEEFQSLQAALRHLDRLENDTGPSRTVDAIKYAALSCLRPLEEFLAKIKKYKAALDIWSKPCRVKGTVDKLKWTFGKKDDIQRLQAYLHIHVGTINMLLAEHGLEQMSIIGKHAEVDSGYIRKELDRTNTFLEDINKKLPSQVLLLQNMHSMIGGLYSLVCGEINSSLKHFSQMVSKVWYVIHPSIKM